MVKEKWMASVMAGAWIWMSAAWAGPIAAIAMVTEIHGAGVIDAKSGQLKKMDRLSTPGTITVAAAAKVVVFYVDGAKEYTLNGPGTFDFSAAGLTRSSASGAMQTKWQDPAYGKTNLLFNVPAVEAGVGLRVMGEIPFLMADTPADGETVAASNLAFSWKMRPHQGAWQFRIVDYASGNVLDEASLLHNHATLPETVQLVPGSTYIWEVRWLDRNGDQQSQSHPFRTLDAENESLAAQLKPGPDAPEATRTLYGLWLVSAGAHRLGRKYLSDSYNPDVMP